MKPQFKFAFITMSIGWFPFMWLCVWGMYQPPAIRIIIGITGMIICIIGAIGYLTMSQNKYFWSSQKELDKIIEEHRESVRQYREAKDKLIRKILDEKQQ